MRHIQVFIRLVPLEPRHANSVVSKLRRAVLNLLQEEDLESLAAGILLGGYEATRFKASAKVSPLATVYIHTPAEKAKAQLSAGVAYAKGTLLAR